MKKNAINIALLLGISPLLIQCVASQQEVNSIELRLRTMDNRMVNMDREVTNLQSKANETVNVGSIEFLQKRQAELGNTVDRLQSELLQIKGKIEETTYRSRNVQDENSQFKSSLAAQFNDTGARIAALEKQLSEANRQIDELKKIRSEDSTKVAASLAKISAERAAESARTAAEKATLEARLEAEKMSRLESEKKHKQSLEKEQLKTKPSVSAKETTSETAKKKPIIESQEAPAAGGDSAASNANEPGKDLYEKAMGIYKAKNYKQAYGIFSEYLAKHPTGDLAANSRFWMGDCRYSQNEFELAILEYQKVIADFSTTAKAPAAMLKQGLAFEKLQDLETAKIIYQKLLTDYPKSEQVETAKKQLEALKK